MTPDEMIEIINAHKEGKLLQCRLKKSSDNWIDVSTPSWNFFGNEYRIKPEVKKSYYRLYSYKYPRTLVRRMAIVSAVNRIGLEKYILPEDTIHRWESEILEFIDDE